MKLLSILQVIRHGRPPKESINLHYDSKHVIHGEQTFGAMQRLFSPPLSDCWFFKGKGGGSRSAQRHLSVLQRATLAAVNLSSRGKRCPTNQDFVQLMPHICR